MSEYRTQLTSANIEANPASTDVSDAGTATCDECQRLLLVRAGRPAVGDEDADPPTFGGRSAYGVDDILATGSGTVHQPCIWAPYTIPCLLSISLTSTLG